MKKSKSRTGDRCTGHCCEEFTLPFGPDELWASYSRWLRHLHQNDQDLLKGSTLPDKPMSPLYTDIHLVAPMVTYLGYGPVRYKMVDPGPVGKIRKFHRYTCKHFDSKKRVCSIYEFRPQVCRTHGVNYKCNYAACKWKDHKELKPKKLKNNILEDECCKKKG